MMRILLIEDEPKIASFIKRGLEEQVWLPVPMTISSSPLPLGSCWRGCVPCSGATANSHVQRCLPSAI